MDWDRDLAGWPLSNTSRQLTVPPHRWHAQEIGDGPLLLLLHGAGATTHSWRDVMPVLARTHRVVALDLPGHGFTRIGRARRSGLYEMTEDLATLCADQNWHPRGIIGHSAGAAVALAFAHRAEQAGQDCPRIIGLNAALGRFDGVAGWLFPLLAKLLALNPLTALAFTMGPDPMRRARRLIANTGSQLSEEGLGYYARLMTDRGHVDGTLKMMSQWNVDALNAALPDIETHTLLLAGTEDKAVAPRISEEAAGRMPNAAFRALDGLGHLAHEEAPDQVAQIILDWLDD